MLHTSLAGSLWQRSLGKANSPASAGDRATCTRAVSRMCTIVSLLSKLNSDTAGPLKALVRVPVRARKSSAVENHRVIYFHVSFFRRGRPPAGIRPGRGSACAETTLGDRSGFPRGGGVRGGAGRSLALPSLALPSPWLGLARIPQTPSGSGMRCLTWRRRARVRT